MRDLKTVRKDLQKIDTESLPAQGGQKRMNASDTISAELIEDVCRRLENNRKVRRSLPGGGRIHIDRQLPFLCIYRRPEGFDDEGTESLVTAEASYLVAPSAARHHSGLAELVQKIAHTLNKLFGDVLVVEIWAKPNAGPETDPRATDATPTFELTTSGGRKLDSTVETLVRHLKKIRVLKQPVDVNVQHGGRTRPPNMKSLLPKSFVGEVCSQIGIAVPPVYRDETCTPAQPFPTLLRSFRRRFSLALRRAFFEFARTQTTIRPPHYHVLGRRAVVQAVWEVDEKLAEVSNAFDYLLNVTPINTHEAWNEFRRLRFEREPEFHYMPLPFDPYLLKRQLFNIRIEKIEDPALANLFREKQEELDRKITMLRDRNTRRFLPGSLQLFDGVDDAIVSLATDILTHVRQQRARTRLQISAAEFVQAAEREFEFYRQMDPGFNARAEVTSKVAGVMVSRGALLVAKDMTVPQHRVDALLQHEVGTHIVTWHNGRSQPFRQLYSGLAGYEELQEGLAVLAEYLVGGLSASRIRQLAARVIAVRMLLDGATFVETFRVLDKTWDFQQRAAFNITMRVYRGGGLTKDAVYLRGFQRIISYIRKGEDLRPLFVGKIAENHIPVIRELQLRKVLKPPPLTPRYMLQPEAEQRLKQIQHSELPFAQLLTSTSAQA